MAGTRKGIGKSQLAKALLGLGARKIPHAFRLSHSNPSQIETVNFAYGDDATPLSLQRPHLVFKHRVLIFKIILRIYGLHFSLSLTELSLSERDN